MTDIPRDFRAALDDARRTRLGQAVDRLGLPMWVWATVPVALALLGLIFPYTVIWAGVGATWLTWRHVQRHGGRPSWVVVELQGAGTHVHRRSPLQLAGLWVAFWFAWFFGLAILGSRTRVTPWAALLAVVVLAGVTWRDVDRGRRKARQSQADRVLWTLRQAIAGVVTCRPEDVSIGPRWNGEPTSLSALGSFVLGLPASARVDDPTLPDRLGARLDHHLPWPAVNVRPTGPTRFEVTPAKQLPDHVPFPVGLPPTPGRIPFGVDVDRRLVAWTFMTSSPHALVAGQSGYGKSHLLASLALAAVRNGYPTIVLDPKRTRVLDETLTGHPGVWRVTDDQAIAATLDAVERLGQDRSRKLEARQVRLDELSEVIVIVDEFSLLVSHLRRAHRRAGGKGEAETVDAVTDMVLSLREFKLHLCLATQRPDVKKVSGDMREQMGGRMLLGPSSTEFAQMMGFAGQTSGIRGRGVTQDGQVFQAFHVDAQVARQVPSTASDPRELLAPFLRNSGSVASVEAPAEACEQPVKHPAEACEAPTEPPATPMEPAERLELSRTECGQRFGVAPGTFSGWARQANIRPHQRTGPARWEWAWYVDEADRIAAGKGRTPVGS